MRKSSVFNFPTLNHLCVIYNIYIYYADNKHERYYSFYSGEIPKNYNNAAITFSNIYVHLRAYRDYLESRKVYSAN